MDVGTRGAKGAPASLKERLYQMPNQSETADPKVNKVSPDSTTHKIEQFYEGVWGIYLLHLLAVVECN